MNIILIGPQGSGKGTQAQLLTETYDLVVLGMGKLLREAAQKDSERGHIIHDLINEKGKLLPDGVVFDLIQENLESIEWHNGIIFDGFPRTVAQFDLLENYLVDQDKFLHLAIYLYIDDETAIDRLANRVTCELDGKTYNLKSDPPPPECEGHITRRPDDQPEAIKNRLSQFKEFTQPIIQLLEEKGILERIDASGTPREVFSQIQAVISRKNLSNG